MRKSTFIYRYFSSHALAKKEIPDCQFEITSINKKVLAPLLPLDRPYYNGLNMLKDPLSIVDPEAYAIMKDEKMRQRRGLELIASENFASKAVLDALGSAMLNKTTEGYPGARYYGGNEFIDKMERLCQRRALQVFRLDSEKWGVNVQALSGVPANFSIYTAIVEPNGPTAMFFQSMPYRIDPLTGLIDYDKLEESAMLYRPKLIIAGVSCYSRHLDYGRFRKIADKCGAYLMADMAHISGLVAAGVIPSPFDYADVVMTTMNKSLRGPRGAMIFYRKGARSVDANGIEILHDIGPKIDGAVFPGLQGATHNHTISGNLINVGKRGGVCPTITITSNEEKGIEKAIAVALKQCLTSDYVDYAKQILKNAQALANRLQEKGYTLATGGTDNHLLLVDLRSKGLEGARIESVLDLAHIACNKNTCPGDKSALRPSGIRLGTSALTSRGFKEQDFIQVADFIHEAVEIYSKHQHRAGKTIKEFKNFINNDVEFSKEVKSLGERVGEFTDNFDIPGNEEI